MAKIEMYTTNNCPYCVQIKTLFNRLGVTFEEKNISGRPELQEELMKKGPSNRTVPQIFVDDVNIGDDDAIMDLYKAGKLETALKMK